MAKKRAIAAGIVAAFGAAGAAYLAVKRAGEEAAAQPEKRSATPTSRASRNLELARIGTQTGAAFAAHRARRVFASAERRPELDAAFELKTAEQVAAALGNMKGALMKIGQMASYLDQGLPEPVRDALSQLQSDAPPMAPELVAHVVVEELGAPPEDVFAEWDPHPIAAASIGQVHRALTKDNRAVAVKVQYPGIAEAIRSDLANADLVFGGIAMLFPGMDPKPIVEEIKARVVEELDYCLEADNQRLFVDYYRDHPFIHIPAVLDELSTARVLTTELATGVRLETVLTWSRTEQDLAAEAIYRYVFRSLYRLHAFNGDPHPGNYLFRPGGQVTFLDYGLVKRFTPREVSMFQRMIEAMVLHEDLDAYRDLLAEEGLLRDHAKFSDDQLSAYFRHFYEFVMTDEPRTLTSEWSSESVRRFFDPSGPYGEVAKAANLTPSFVIIQRINLGLGAILGDGQVRLADARVKEGLGIGQDLGDPHLHRAHRSQLAFVPVQDGVIGHLGDPLSASHDDAEPVPQGRCIGKRRFLHANDRHAALLAGLAQPTVVEAADDRRVVAVLVRLAHQREHRSCRFVLVGVVFEMRRSVLQASYVRYEARPPHLDDQVKRVGVERGRADRVDPQDPALNGLDHPALTRAAATRRPGRGPLLGSCSRSS